MKQVRKVLVVEDNAEERKMCALAVEYWGYSAIQSSDGERGWEVLNDNPDVSLIILDIGLPRLDGREFIRRVRDCAMLAHIPIIIVSGLVTIHEIRQYLEDGASRFLAKPFKIAELKEYADKLMKP